MLEALGHHTNPISSWQIGSWQFPGETGPRLKAQIEKLEVEARIRRDHCRAQLRVSIFAPETVGCMFWLMSPALFCILTDDDAYVANPAALAC